MGGERHGSDIHNGGSGHLDSHGLSLSRSAAESSSTEPASAEPSTEPAAEPAAAEPPSLSTAESTAEPAAAEPAAEPSTSKPAPSKSTTKSASTQSAFTQSALQRHGQGRSRRAHLHRGLSGALPVLGHPRRRPLHTGRDLRRRLGNLAQVRDRQQRWQRCHTAGVQQAVVLPGDGKLLVRRVRSGSLPRAGDRKPAQQQSRLLWHEHLRQHRHPPRDHRALRGGHAPLLRADDQQRLPEYRQLW
mgnify:FL=1